MSRELTLSPAYYSVSNNCGYCNSKPKVGVPSFIKSASVGFHIYKCSPEKYESLINCGFRRSGDYLYRNDALRTCCQHHTIRTCLRSDSSPQFEPLREHKKCVNKLANQLNIELANPKNKFFLESSIVNCHKGKRLVANFEPATFTDEKYQLFRKYQIAVHNEKPETVTPSGFERFLCNDPFSVYCDPDELGKLNKWYVNPQPTKLTGAFHEVYYIDGEMAAISVIDILPNCVSSVYFIWDPKWAKLSLGTFSALKDIVFTHAISKKHYYLGYYVPMCRRMQYKKKFGGEILDVASHKFVPISVLEKMNILERPSPLVLQEVPIGMEWSGTDEIYTDDSSYPESWILKPGHEFVDVASQIYTKKFEIDLSLVNSPIQDPPTIFDSDVKENIDIPDEVLPSIMLGAIPPSKYRTLLVNRQFGNIDFLISWDGSSRLDQLTAETIATSRDLATSFFNCIRILGIQTSTDGSILHVSIMR